MSRFVCLSKEVTVIPLRKPVNYMAIVNLNATMCLRELREAVES